MSNAIFLTFWTCSFWNFGKRSFACSLNYHSREPCVKSNECTCFSKHSKRRRFFVLALSLLNLSSQARKQPKCTICIQCSWVQCLHPERYHPLRLGLLHLHKALQLSREEISTLKDLRLLQYSTFEACYLQYFHCQNRIYTSHLYWNLFSHRRSKLFSCLTLFSKSSWPFSDQA